VVQDTLRAARQGLAERDFLVAAHEHSEAALTRAAAGLRAELAATAAELAAVFAKVDAQAGVAAANTVVVRDLRTDAAKQLKVLLARARLLLFRVGRTAVRDWLSGHWCRLQDKTMSVNEAHVDALALHSQWRRATPDAPEPSQGAKIAQRTRGAAGETDTADAHYAGAGGLCGRGSCRAARAPG
jgi:hypothetical protein